MPSLNLTDEQKEVVRAQGHCLVKGGPGSGKTTVAILKAARFLANEAKIHQKVLFLSFSNSAVDRVIESLEDMDVDDEIKSLIDVCTYHSFFWRLIKSQGSLLGLPKSVSVLPPVEEATCLFELRREYGASADLTVEQTKQKKQEERRLLKELANSKGKVCFAEFAKIASELLSRSTKLSAHLANCFPMIMLDEFQDTDKYEWLAIRSLGEHATIVSFADPNQRIFEFRGADQQRLNQFSQEFDVTSIDLGRINHRSTGTDILDFGEAVLNGKFKSGAYSDVYFGTYARKEISALTDLITEVYAARKRLANFRANWSIVVLVPTKELTRKVSLYFNNPQKMTPVYHTALIDDDAAILASEVFAFLLEQKSGEKGFAKLVELVANFYKGRSGVKTLVGNIKNADDILTKYDAFNEKISSGKTVSTAGIIPKMKFVHDYICTLQFSGNPTKDWLAVRYAIENSKCRKLQDIAQAVRDLRLLNRTKLIRDTLASEWLESGEYGNALEAIKRSFVAQYFGSNTTKRVERGVFVMNMHKSKGKQFDEVIIFEGWPVGPRGNYHSNPNRILRGNDLNSNERELRQARQKLHVAVTRAKQRVTILTPKDDPCALLLS